MRLALLFLFCLTGCFESRYLMQQAGGQLHLLQSRRKIVDVLADPAVPEATKERLRLAMAARDFGIKVLGLRGGDAYTRYLETNGKPVAWNVSAAPKDRLRAVMYKFPITGRVPYLGFFKEADARREEARLKALDLDVYVRGVSGYSTLGITSDPVYSSMLEGPPARIVEVVLHEMLHGTLWLAGRGEWNESVATFVGYRGAALFFSQRSAAQAQKILEDARKREEITNRFSRFLEPFFKELEALYASPRTRGEKIEAREEVFSRLREEFVKQFPPPPGRKPGGFATGPINNAVLAANAVYHRSTPEHARLFRAVGNDLAAFIRLYKHAVEDKDDPIGYLRGFGR